MDTAQAEAPPLRPLTLGDLFDETIRVYRKNFGLLVALTLVQDASFVVLLLFGGSSAAVASRVAATPGQPPNPALIAGFVGLFALAFVVGLVTYPIGLGAMIHAISEARFGRRLGVGEALRRSARRYWGLLGLMFVLGIALMVMFITMIGIPLFVYFGIAWGMSYAVYLLEGTSVFGALSRSRALVRGSWWRTLGVAILFALFNWIISFVIGLPFGLVGGLLTAFMRTSEVAQPLATVVNLLGNLIAQFVGTPITYIGWVLYYCDLRVRKEGLDLQVRAERLATPSFGAEPETAI